MRYPKELYQRMVRELDDRRRAALDELDRRILFIQEKHPDIWQLRSQAAMLGAQIGMALIMGNKDQYDNLLREIAESNSRIRELLTAAGFPTEYLEAQHTCGLCQDKGFIDGRSCECRKAILNRLAYEMLSNISKVDECSFDTFDLGYYADTNRKTMSKLLEACKRYAFGFDCKAPNLLFIGPTGLGKTHLSLAISREVVNKGCLVMYASAPQMIERIVDSAMGDGSADEYRDLIYKCELLVIDDLGTEFKTHITKSEVYNLINSRLNEGRSTIINTNLSMSEIEDAYDNRVVSRFVGSYSINSFSGKDIRFEKRRKDYGAKNSTS